MGAGEVLLMPVAAGASGAGEPPQVAPVVPACVPWPGAGAAGVLLVGAEEAEEAAAGAAGLVSSRDSIHAVPTRSRALRLALCSDLAASGLTLSTAFSTA